MAIKFREEKKQFAIDSKVEHSDFGIGFVTHTINCGLDKVTVGVDFIHKEKTMLIDSRYLEALEPLPISMLF